VSDDAMGDERAMRCAGESWRGERERARSVGHE